ncbi:hypothetical protein EVAR_84712_1 [Eumeta japonica]|uniref:Uncharacterized protein n=1 Tax=Eumeta variegata TaxID=151549 RepID=A0A4C1VT40_EUMVA|nr:hypothetical protein EVAR_84712_1 [Eumeta japonica]
MELLAEFDPFIREHIEQHQKLKEYEEKAKKLSASVGIDYNDINKRRITPKFSDRSTGDQRNLTVVRLNLFTRKVYQRRILMAECSGALRSIQTSSGGARRRRRRRPPTASRLKGPRKQKSFAYKLLKRGLANLMSPTSTSGVAPPLQTRFEC